MSGPAPIAGERSGARRERPLRRRVARAALALAAVLLGGLAAGAALLERELARPFPAALLSRERSTPFRALDRRGRLLRETVAADGTRGRAVPLEEISPWLVLATLTAEDRRFLEHAGVDPLAALRAAAQNTLSWRRISGASTLTMQLVRLLRPAPRTWAIKLEESLLALRLERALDKRAILEEYLNRAPYGGNVVGAEAAALRTFGKPARDLSPAEAALLAALPQGPARLDPLRNLERARRRARWILDEMHRLGRLDSPGHARAIVEVPAIEPTGAPDLAPEAVDWLVRGGDGASPAGASAVAFAGASAVAFAGASAGASVDRGLRAGEPRATPGVTRATPGVTRTTHGVTRATHGEPRTMHGEARAAHGTPRVAPDDPRATPGAPPLRTTLDLDLQRDVEGIVRAEAPRLAEAGAREAAVVVLDVETAEVLAFAGPAARPRLPGSTLKPFVYALALEDGRLSAASVLDDAPLHLESASGDYAPRNYDGRFHGRVSLRQALAGSLNVPAVLALRKVGVPRAVALLRALGLSGVAPDPALHGLGLALGDARVAPVELAGAYACLARGGRFLAPRGRMADRGGETESRGRSEGPSEGRRESRSEGRSEGPSECDRSGRGPPRLLSEETCAITADILADDAARALTFGTGSEIALPFPVAAKTGTSVDWRDNWVAGFTATRAVVVWVGNPDGRPLRCTSGLDGAGPIFRAVMLRLGPGGAGDGGAGDGGAGNGDAGDGDAGRAGDRLRCGPLPRPPGVLEREVCAGSGRLAGVACPRRSLEVLARAHVPVQTCDGACDRPEEPLTLVTPRPGDRFRVSRSPADETRFLVLRARAAPDVALAWEIDGSPIAITTDAHEVVWPAAPGAHALVVRSGADVRRARFEVEERK